MTEPHVPNFQWVKGTKRLISKPSFFGLKKTLWFTRCCGKTTLRVSWVQEAKCESCGEIGSFPATGPDDATYAGRCLECGHLYAKNTKYDRGYGACGF